MKGRGGPEIGTYSQIKPFFSTECSLISLTDVILITIREDDRAVVIHIIKIIFVSDEHSVI